MHLKSEKFDMLNPELLVYCIPKGLNNFTSFSGIIRAVKKNEVDFEVSSFNLLESRPFVDFLTVLENRCNLYNNTSLFVGQELNVGFRSVDKTSKQPIFATTRKKEKLSLRLESFLRERKFFIEKFDKKLLIKTRLLMAVKGGYLAVYFGIPAFVGRSSTMRNQRSYKSWFVMSSYYYGFLSCFSLIGITKRKVYKAERQKLSFYYLKSNIFSYTILLEKKTPLSLL